MPFDLKWIHLIGPLLATLAMFFVGDNLVRQDRGKDMRIVPTILLFVAALGFHFLFTEGNFLDRISFILLDFGIGMIIDSAYLKRKNVHPKVFWGLGIVSLVAGGLMIFFLHFFGLLIVKAKDWISADANSETKIELLVELGPDDTVSEIAPLLKKYGATWIVAFPEVDINESEDLAQYFLVSVTEKKAAQLLIDLDADDENVDHAELNLAISLELPLPSAEREISRGNFLANDPRISSQWWMQTEAANEIHSLLKHAKPAKKAVVAIVDTGVDASHEDLKDGFDKSPDDTDNHGHGTHCACLAGAITNNKSGIASLNWEGKYIRIRSFAALNKSGQGTIYSVAKAIIAAAESGADVISLSLGGRSSKPPKTHLDAVKYALSRNSILVVAAGNNNEDARFHSPANIDGVITVAAIDEQGKKASFSNTNTKLKMPIAAPGVNILSCTPKNNYVSWNGTSMATPIVAGLAGVIRAFRPDLSAAEVYGLMENTGSTGPSVGQTGKIIDPLSLLKKL